MAGRAEKQNIQIEGDVMTEVEQEFIATNTPPQFEAMIQELERITAESSEPFRWHGSGHEFLLFGSVGLHLNLKPIASPKVFKGTATLRAAPDRAYHSGFPLEIRDISIHPEVSAEREIRWRMNLAEQEPSSLSFFTNEELAVELAKRLVNIRTNSRMQTPEPGERMATNLLHRPIRDGSGNRLRPSDEC